MSAPPRTEVRAEKRAIADRIVVFSLVYALAVRGFLKPDERPEDLPKGREFQAIPWDCSPDLARHDQKALAIAGATFSPQIGEPKPITIESDFLIGWRVGDFGRRLALLP